MLRIDNLVKKYGKVNALNGISYEQSDDASIGIVGSNGAGKTTLCMAANGYIFVDGGDIVLDNYSVVNQSQKVREITSLYTEELRLYDDLTVKECINFYSGLYQCGDVAELALALHVDDYIGKKVRSLSTGMRKKVNLLVSMMTYPRFLFLDEPFSGLDPNAKNEFLELLKEIRKRYGTQLIVSSHDLYELENVVENVIIMEKGNIIEAGSLLGLINRYFDDVCISIRFKSNVNMQDLYKVRQLGNDLYEAEIKRGELNKFFLENVNRIHIIDVSSKKYSLENLYERIAGYRK